MSGRAAPLWITALFLCASVSCSGDGSNGGGAGAGGAAGTAATGGAGGSGGSATGGTGGALQGRTCGEGAPCSAGATCTLAIHVESKVSCECDPSGHYLCSAASYGGAPAFQACDSTSACKQDAGAADGGGPDAGLGPTCSQSNGWCTRSCQCSGPCTTECNGSGPAEGYLGDVCDLDFCNGPLGSKSSACEIKDGACTYAVSCMNGTVTGSCP